jgi:hypothetical protein
MAALRCVECPGYRALILRRRPIKMLEKPDALLDISRE